MNFTFRSRSRCARPPPRCAAPSAPATRRAAPFSSRVCYSVPRASCSGMRNPRSFSPPKRKPIYLVDFDQPLPESNPLLSLVMLRAPAPWRLGVFFRGESFPLPAISRQAKKRPPSRTTSTRTRHLSEVSFFDESSFRKSLNTRLEGESFEGGERDDKRTD